MRKSAIAAVAMGILSGTAAAAENRNAGGLYLNFDIGSAKSGAHAADYDRLAADLVGSGATVLESRIDRRQSGWGLALWGIQEEHFGIEVSRLKLGVMSHDAILELNDGAAQATLPVTTAVSSRGWSLSSVGIVHLNESLQLEGRAGAYFGKATTTTSWPAQSAGSVQFSRGDSSTSLMLGGGIVYTPPKSGFGLTAGYTWLNDIAGKPLGRVSVGVRMWMARGSP
jgi:opacity protein-like surface antigen